eukprot:191821_1
MGSCRSRSIDTMELIEIRNSINKQNESIQTMMVSTKNEFQALNDKICQIQSQLNHHNEKNSFHKQVQKSLYDITNQLESVKLHECMDDDIKKESPQSELVFPNPKPASVTFHSENNLQNSYNHNTNAKHETYTMGVQDATIEHDSQLQAIHFKMNSMRNAIRSEIQNAIH